MSIKSKIGPALIAFFAILTVLVWLFVRQSTFMFSSHDILTHSLGQLSGLVGLTLFALTFTLTTRAKWIENLFGGLDKVYKTHHLVGSLAFILLLFHPLLLVLNFIPSNVKQAAIYLLPSSSWAVNYGIIALLSMTALIILTLYINLKYQNWKLSHKLMGIVYLIALFHVFLVTTDITYYPALKYYMILISGIGGISYIYGSFLRPFVKKRIIYAVDSIEKRDSIEVITLSPKNDKLNFEPGQFVFISLPKSKIGSEQHPFTIASSPSDTKIRFAIKNLGDYTSKMSEIKKNSLVEIEGPYGKLNRRSKSQNQVWIAGGIGITPFLSMLNHIKKLAQNTQKIHMYYCTKDKKEAVFLEEIESIAKKTSNLHIIPWYSNEKGRISADSIEKISSIKNTNFIICGPQKMMESLSSQLIKNGVSKSSIQMEEFDLR